MSFSEAHLAGMTCFSISLKAGGTLYPIPVAASSDGKYVTFKSTDSSKVFDCRIRVLFAEHGLQGEYTLKQKNNPDLPAFKGQLNQFVRLEPNGEVQCSMQGTVDLRYAFFSKSNR